MKKDHRGCSRLPAHEVIGEGTRKILRVSQISFASYVRFCSLFLSSRHVSRCSLSALGMLLLRKRSPWRWCTVETGVLSQTSRATHPLVPWTALCLQSGTPSLPLFCLPFLALISVGVSLRLSDGEATVRGGHLSRAVNYVKGMHGLRVRCDGTCALVGFAPVCALMRTNSLQCGWCGRPRLCGRVHEGR